MVSSAAAAAAGVCALAAFAPGSQAFLLSQPSRATQLLRMSAAVDSSACIGRRQVLQVAATTFAAVAAATPAHAALFGGDEVQEAVTAVAAYTPRVNKLIADLQSKTLKGGPDDSVVVLRTLKTYFEPLQAAMAEVAPTLGLAGESQERAVTLSLLMKGHLLELAAACGSQSAMEQLKESEEVQETLEEFLKLASTKYEVPTYEARRSATAAEYYGAFGCEAWGQKRVKDSNQCAPDP